MFYLTDDLRIERLKPLIPPAILMEQYAISEVVSATVAQGRHAATRILRGEDDRLLVVVGPCSIHDVEAAREYAEVRRHVLDEIARVRAVAGAQRGDGVEVERHRLGSSVSPWCRAVASWNSMAE